MKQQIWAKFMLVLCYIGSNLLKLFFVNIIQVEYNFNICEGGGSADRIGEVGKSVVKQMKLVEEGVEGTTNSCFTRFMSWHLYWSKKHRIAWCKVHFPRRNLIKFKFAGAQGRIFQLGDQLPQVGRRGGH